MRRKCSKTSDENGMNQKAIGSGLLLVLSGPSGVGKGTVVEALKKICPERLGRSIAVSVSKTTRKPRPGEQEGVHYYFTDRDSFLNGVANNLFLEYAEYAGNLYGTPRDMIEQKTADGAIVVLDIDTQGAFQVRSRMPEALLVFLLPPSMEELEQRLRGRGTETEEAILKRLSLAAKECKLAARFDAKVYNRNVTDAALEICELIENRLNAGQTK